MAYGKVTNPSLLNRTFAGPPVASYDSGYEHSFDRYIDVRLLVLDAENDSKNESKAEDAPATYALAC